MFQDTHTLVEKYYGEELKSSGDLKTNACCTMESIDEESKSVLSMIHDEVSSKYYGCGLVKPELLKGKTILDLGCGSGRDVYLLSYLVGEEGHVFGVDMTEEQIQVAEKHQEYHTEKFGFKKSNVTFIKAKIEDINEIGLDLNSFDVVVSNCVINLCPDKKSVFKSIKNILKPGGEFYFSDVYSDRRIPRKLINDPVLYGECLSGALYQNDFRRTLTEVGFSDARIYKSNKIEIEDELLKQKIGNIGFDSITYRVFNLDQLEDACEDYGQSVIYKGTIENQPHEFRLDKSHIFETGRSALVCGNTFNILKESRFGDHFEFIGSFETHYGLFEDCGTSNETASTTTSCC